jgi:hypothetical protein
MTEVLHSSSPHSSSPSSFHNHSDLEEDELGISRVTDCDEVVKAREKERRDELSLLALIVTLFRKSFWISACKTDSQDLCGMEIGWPTNVQHVAHVTFDRFNGFLGLPVEFEPEVPRRAPSASATVFGVSTESMQLSYDHRGNSVPTILLLMQQHLYGQGGLQAEGIFRINAENGQEEFVRNQLNTGVIPQGIDVHCLAGLIKAWFREMPSGVLDPLSQEDVMRCESEEDCSALVRILPPAETSLLNWAINLMADVVQHEHLNKMNAHNIAMVFAPNMTQMADPLNALMYAVQVMNVLKTLITKTLREREDSVVDSSSLRHLDPSDKNGRQSPIHPSQNSSQEESEKTKLPFVPQEPPSNTDQELVGEPTELARSIGSNQIKPSQQLFMQEMGPGEKSKGLCNIDRINSRVERIEAWR